MKQRRPSHAGFFIFRTPLLPVESLKLLSVISAHGDVTPPPETAWSELLDRSTLGVAVALQSPNLWNAISQRRVSGSGLAAAPELLPLFRYVSRGATRCTPRGLFASTGIGTIGTRTVLSSPDTGRTSIAIDLSLDYLSTLLQLELDSESAPAGVSFIANPTLAMFGCTLSLREYGGIGADRVSQQVVLQASALLQEVVRSLGDVPVTARQMDDLLAGKGVPILDRKARFRELIAAQILVPELGVSTTAKDPVLHFIGQLPRSGPLGRVRTTLSRVRAQLRRSKWTPSDFQVSALHAIRAVLPPASGFEQPNRVFQIESFNTTADLTLNETVVNKLAKAVERLHTLFGDLHAGRTVQFVDAFLERFGEATVPLLRVIDPEHGIATSLSATTASDWAARGRRAAMLRLMQRALGQQLQAVELDEAFWRSVSDDKLPPLPPGFCAVCSVVAPSTDAIDEGTFEILLDSVVGTDGTELWARHSRLNSMFMASVERMERSIRPTADDSIVYADVLLAPNIGVDVAWRPGRQRYQIACTPCPSIQGVEQLPLSDLYVHVRNDRVQLLSRRLASEVIPLIGSAIDPEAVRSPLFRFLYSLSQQGYAAPLQWDWGEIEGSPFLPRVHAEGVTFTPARWRIDAADIRCWPPTVDDASVLGSWRHSLRLPLLVALRYGEDRIGCDLTHPIGVEMIRKEVARAGFAILEELRAAPEELCIGSGAARFSHELLVPFVHPPPTTTEMNAARASTSVWSAKFSQGVMLPGSGWIYAKLYASPRSIQSMLSHEVPALVAKLREECGAQDAFFFRYKDTDWHLRLRTHVTTAAKRSRALEFIGAVAADLQAKEVIWRLQYDTYYREIERFGGEHACRLVERFFTVESDLAYANLLEWQDDETYLHQALPLAAGWTFWTWTRLGLTAEEMLDLARRLSSSLRRRTNAAGTREDGARQLHAIAEVFDRDGAFRSYSKRGAIPLGKIASLARTGVLEVDLKDLAGDLTHLMVNRLFSNAHEARELNIYLMLERHIHRARLHAPKGKPK